MKWLLLLALTACGGTERPFVCRTYCGLELQHYERTVDAKDPWTCPRLQQIEDATLVGFTRVDDPNFSNTCEQIAGFSILVFPRDILLLNDGRQASGATSLETQEIWLNHMAPGRSSLVHELAHVVQRGYPNSCAHSAKNAEHWCWDTNGISDAIERVKYAVEIK